MSRENLLKWILEREAVRAKKEAGQPKSWTTDPILQKFSFCNVHREDDKGTRWIANNWRGPRAHDPDLWFAMVVARLVNWPDTLEELGYPVPWDPKRFIEVLQERKRTGQKVFSGAYIVSTNGHRMDKAEYLATRVLTPLWNSRNHIRPTMKDTLGTFHQRLLGFDGLGGFMAAQVVADVKYSPALRDAVDWHYWAASGPGSRRGLNRVLGNPKDAPWNEGYWFLELSDLRQWINKQLGSLGYAALHAQDLQNCLCEFDKYERTRLGEGRPRTTYPGV